MPITPVESDIEPAEEKQKEIEVKKVRQEPEQLKCPKGFPQKKWDSWSDSAKRNHLRIVYGGDE